jgi:hypothetical protein
VEVPLEGDEGVAGGGDVLGVDFGFLGDAEFVVQRTAMVEVSISEADLSDF